jgi:DNA-binding transcriptional ArsR family regulator
VDAKDVAAILAAIAWPITALIVAFYFRTPVRSLLNRLADSLKVKSLKFALFGAEVELTPEEAKGALDEMLQEIVEAMNELLPAEVDLFLKIDSAEGRLTVLDLIPDFKRESVQHTQLRKLRDRKLIRPIEGGNWQPQKHPIVTRFGHLIRKLHPKVSPQAR